MCVQTNLHIFVSNNNQILYLSANTLDVDSRDSCFVFVIKWKKKSGRKMP
jgi:hypothetical protein